MQSTLFDLIINYWINPLLYFSRICSECFQHEKPTDLHFDSHPEHSKKRYVADFYETYHTRTGSNKMTKEEAEEECYELFNIKAGSQTVRTKMEMELIKQ